MLNKTVTIVNQRGLHARASARFTSTATRFNAAMRVRIHSPDNSGAWSDATSIMSLMLLAAGQGTLLDIQTEGKEEQKAMDAISQLIEQRFGEED